MKMKRTIIRPNGVPNSISEQVATPIMPSVVYASQSPNALDEQYEGKQKGYTYAREGHPNAEILAHLIDKLEGREYFCPDKKCKDNIQIDVLRTPSTDITVDGKPLIIKCSGEDCPQEEA